jgi:hypothetical protein
VGTNESNAEMRGGRLLKFDGAELSTLLLAKPLTAKLSEEGERSIAGRVKFLEITLT